MRLASDRTAIVVVDIAGHGAAHACLSAAVVDMIALALRRGASPAAALGCADDRLRAFDDESPYAVAFVAVINPALRTAAYASAGHDVAFALADNGRIRHLVPTAPMLVIPYPFHLDEAALTRDATETLVIETKGVADCLGTCEHANGRQPDEIAIAVVRIGAARSIARSWATMSGPKS